MRLEENEKFILGFILRYPSTNRIPERITNELTEDKFSSSDHRLIYRAIRNLVLDSQIPNTLNVYNKLNGTGDKVGGIEYLESLTQFPEMAGVYEPTGFENCVKLLDTAGTYRSLLELVKPLREDSLENLLHTHPDVTEFIANFATKLGDTVKDTKSTYVEISEIADEELRRFELEAKGEIVNIVPCHLPCLHTNLIPRPGSFGGIIGLSGTGKTSLALQIVLGVAQGLYKKREEGKVSINSLETNRLDVFRKMACFIAKLDSEMIAKGKLLKNQEEKYREAISYVKRLPIVIDDNPSITSDEVYFQASILHLKYKRILGISDYTELFTDKAANEELRVSGIIRKIKSISRKLGSCEILLSQFNNDGIKNIYKKGSLTDSRYSGAYNQALDWGVVIYNPRAMRKKQIQFTLPDGMNEDYAYLIKEKDRQYSTSQMILEWIPEYSMFRDLSVDLFDHYQILEPSEF
jgi:replicative DNA helicase